jgi:Nucleoplasmin-like domain
VVSKYSKIRLCTSPLPLVLSRLPPKMIVAPWGLTVRPGSTYKYAIPPFTNLKISNAALGTEIYDKSSRTTLIIETTELPPVDSKDEESDKDEDKPGRTHIVLTSLTLGKVGKPLVGYVYIWLNVFRHRLSSRFMISCFLSLPCWKSQPSAASAFTVQLKALLLI